MKKVMVLCTGNSCRSQMAEGFLREIGRDRVEAHSAGVIAAGVNSRAIEVMREAGIDISKHKSKVIDPAVLNQMDIIITVCGNAEASCPVTPPHITRLHIPIDDPVGTVGSDEFIMSDFRRAREEIRREMERVVASL